MLEVTAIRQSYVGGKWSLTATITNHKKDVMHVDFTACNVSFYRCHSLHDPLIFTHDVPLDTSHCKHEQLSCFKRFIPFMMRHAYTELNRQIQQFTN